MILIDNNYSGCIDLQTIQDGCCICLDKPLTWTSFNLVNKVRCILSHSFGVRKLKVGHAGTLDPLATGVMLICTGKATKHIEELQAGTKEYICTIKLGATTPSYDLEHDIDAVYSTDHITEQLIAETLPQFAGNIEQIPPIYSACKIDGKRAYKLARSGANVEIKAKLITIYSIEMQDYADLSLTLRVVCGKGTYIRSLARDIGTALNSGAHLIALRRTKVGNTAIDNCITTEQLQQILNTPKICTV